MEKYHWIKIAATTIIAWCVGLIGLGVKYKEMNYELVMLIGLFVLLIFFLICIKYFSILNEPKIKTSDIKKRSTDVIELCIVNTGAGGNIEVSLENTSEVEARWIRKGEKNFKTRADFVNAMWKLAAKEEIMLSEGEEGRVKITRINKKISGTKICYLNFYIPKIQQVSVYRFRMPDDLKNVSIKDFKNIGTYKEGGWLKKKIVKWRMQ
jgi:hypothetical protein